MPEDITQNWYYYALALLLEYAVSRRIQACCVGQLMAICIN